MNSKKNRLLKILEKIFKNSKIKNKIENLGIGKVKGWDSLKHFHLLLEIEKEFNIKFATKTFSNLKSISQIIKEINKNEKK